MENDLRAEVTSIEKAQLVEACQQVLKPAAVLLLRRALFRLDELEAAVLSSPPRTQQEVIDRFKDSARGMSKPQIDRALTEVWPADYPAGVSQAPEPDRTITIVVNGQPVTVKAGPVRGVIEAAVKASGQIGAPVEQWELRTRDGEVIPHSLPEEWELSGGTLLFMNLGLPSTGVSQAPGKETEMNAEKELQRIAQACADNGVGDTDDVPLADVVRGALSQSRSQIQSLETAREFAYAEIRELKRQLTALSGVSQAPEEKKK